MNEIMIIFAIVVLSLIIGKIVYDYIFVEKDAELNLLIKNIRKLIKTDIDNWSFIDGYLNPIYVYEKDQIKLEIEVFKEYLYIKSMSDGYYNGVNVKIKIRPLGLLYDIKKINKINKKEEKEKKTKLSMEVAKQINQLLK